jgi:hypothetical protein
MGFLRSSPRKWLPLCLAFSGLVGIPGCDHTVAGPDQAVRPSFAKVGPGGTTLDVRANVRLLNDGTVRVRVEAGCPEGLVVLEALLTVSQTAAFSLAPVPVTCTGRTEKHWLVVPAQDGSFEPGPVTVSGFLLVTDPETFATEQGQDTETVDLR